MTGPATTTTALIAEDEPLLAAALQSALARAWPGLAIVAVVGDGASAVHAALDHRPDIVFFDIRMPGMDGLEAAAALADAWDDGAAQATPFPQLVFVTAYDQYAVQAFEAQAVDYLLKPVQTERLRKTVERLQQALAARTGDAASTTPPSPAMEDTLAQLRQLLGAVGIARSAAPPAPSAGPLQLLQVSVGSSIRMVPLAEVLYFEAADKYLRVLTAEHEYLIRTPLRELLAQLDAQRFWQVHRGTVVCAPAITAVQRDEAGKLWLQLRGRPERLAVSRLYAHLFKAM